MGSIPAESGSSLTSPDPFSTAPLSSTPTETNDNNDNGMPSVSRSSSLLFGFLITFLALFIGFMACGYSSRRAARVRGANYADRLRDVGNRRLIKMKKPRLWDVWIDARSGRDKWKDMTPLSASIMHPKRKDSLPTQSQSSEDVDETPAALREDEPPQEYFPSFYFGSRTFGGLRYPIRPLTDRPRGSPRVASEPSISSLLLPTSDFVRPSRPTFSARPRETMRSKSVERTPSSPEKDGSSGRRDVHAQVSVLIAMPSPTHVLSRNELRKAPSEGEGESENGIVDEAKEKQPYYEIGVASVPVSGLGWSGLKPDESR